jgi:hypothetical protein
MTELQIGLLAIGALVVVGVLAYNRIQERGVRRDGERAFRSAHADALLGDAPQRREPHPEGLRPVTRYVPADIVSLPDARFDYVIELALAAAPPPGAVQENWKAIERRHRRPVRLAASADGASWQPFATHGSAPVARLLAGLQLVSREGAVGEAELIEFRSSLETLAAALGAAVSAPEMKTAVETARELDAFCSAADVQVVLHVVAAEGGSLVGSKLRATAEAGGLVLEDSGKFALRADGGALLYTLGAQDGSRFDAATIRNASLQALSLELDLPRVPDTRRVFESMARLGNQLAVLLSGRLQDDNGNVLDERALAAIASQLDAVRARLEERGLAPGSVSALRIFA